MPLNSLPSVVKHSQIRDVYGAVEDVELLFLIKKLVLWVPNALSNALKTLWLDLRSFDF